MRVLSRFGLDGAYAHVRRTIRWPLGAVCDWCERPRTARRPLYQYGTAWASSGVHWERHVFCNQACHAAWWTDRRNTG